ncbi:MAG: Xaa-Pro aminopeptidase [Wigglesworthia glossinidia]|nr:Xaa-Pro aminopeptidase [Wigglesworthia glossinidia]
MHVEYLNRRKKLFSKMVSNSAALIFAAPENNKKFYNYQYKQDKNFFYFTGFNESQALLILIKRCDKNQCILFNQKKNNNTAQWHGENLGQKSALKKLHVNYSYPWNEIQKKLYLILNYLHTIYYPIGLENLHDKIFFLALKKIKLKSKNNKKFCIPNYIKDWRRIVYEMRLIKSKKEIFFIQKACHISSMAHLRAIKYCKVKRYEYELVAEIHHEFLRHGCLNNAYNTIVGSGYNSCILHYTNNNKQMKNNELVLIDAGCEYNNYVSDVTRTIPVNGIFSKEQSIIYNIVLDMLNLAIKLFKPDITIEIVSNQVIKLLLLRLKSIGLLDGTINNLMHTKTYKKFFMHKLCHWIGLSVHDCEYIGYSNNIKLKPGMTLSVEPGIYIPKNNNIPILYRGIGIRIEENILITSKGNKVLTKYLIKKPCEIEQIMQSV